MAEIDTRTEDGILHLRVLGTLFKKDLGDFIKNHFSLVESSGCIKPGRQGDLGLFGSLACPVNDPGNAKTGRCTIYLFYRYPFT